MYKPEVAVRVLGEMKERVGSEGGIDQSSLCLAVFVQQALSTEDLSIGDAGAGSVSRRWTWR